VTYLSPEGVKFFYPQGPGGVVAALLHVELLKCLLNLEDIAITTFDNQILQGKNVLKIMS
jgi:hypothetical protein